MQFVAFLLLATVPASLGVSSGAKAKLAFIEERMHARMKTMTPETATLTNIEKSVLNMAQTKLSKTSANADAANLTAFLDQIQELLDNTMKKNILLRKEQTQADLDAGFGNLSSCLHPNDTSFNEDLKALSATHKTCRSEQDAVWKDYDATCILAKNIYLQNIKTLCDAYATAAVFPNPITTCSMDDAVQVPTIGNFLGDMEKFFEDEYESLKEKKDKCDTARDTPFEHEELCKSKICSYYDHKISCDGKQKSLEEEACTLHKGHTCSGYSDCYTDKVEVYNGVVTLAKDGEAAVKAEWILVARIECLLNALKMEDAEVDAGITACKQKSYATDPVALTMHGDAPGARSCEEVFFQPGTATFSNIWYNGLPTATPAESCASQCCRADEFVPGYPSGAACPYVSDVTTTTPTTTTTTTKAATTTTKASFGFGGPATIASFGGFGGFPR